mgnify:CR=1 FL=1
MITLDHADEITATKIATLESSFKEKVIEWLRLMKQAGINPYIYEGYRTPERQDELYRQGRTTKGPKITNAAAWQSYHQYRFAFDWVPLRKLEKPDMYEANWDNEKAYKTGQKVAEPLGLKWISWETPHLQDARFTRYQDIQTTYPDYKTRFTNHR